MGSRWRRWSGGLTWQSYTDGTGSCSLSTTGRWAPAALRCSSASSRWHHAGHRLLAKSIQRLRRAAGAHADPSRLDIWKPGELNGIFRGVNPAFVTSTAALHAHWRDRVLEHGTLAKGESIAAALAALAALAQSRTWYPDASPSKVPTAAFERGLMVETSGPYDEVIKMLPPLAATDAEIDLGLAILADAVQTICVTSGREWVPFDHRLHGETGVVVTDAFRPRWPT